MRTVARDVVFDPLPFPAGQHNASLAKLCFILLRQLHNKIVRVSCFGRFHDFFHVGLKPPVTNVFGDAAGKQ